MTKTLFSATLIISFLWLKDRWTFFHGNDHTTDIARYISLQRQDEYVVASLQTSETYTRIHCVKKMFGQCLLPTQVEVNPDVFYRYFIKLSELKFSSSNDTLNFEVPSLYLSTPVAIDTASLEHRYQSKIPNLNCRGTFNLLMDSLSGRLTEKGMAQVGSVQEKTAKSLADNLHVFLVNQDNKINHPNISVTFKDDPGNSAHVFRYHSILHH